MQMGLMLGPLLNETYNEKGYTMQNRTLKTLLSLSVVGLIILRVNRPELKIDAVTLGLLVLALLPWFINFLESAEFPGGWKLKFRELAKQQEAQQEIINQLVVFSMSNSIYEKLKHLYYCIKQGRGEYIYQDQYEETTRREFLFLRDNGYLASAHEGYFNPGPHLIGKDLVPLIKLTPIGYFYVEQREKLEQKFV